MLDELRKFVRNLGALGSRKLLALGVGALILVGTILGTAYVLSRPGYEPLYSGLDAQESSRVAAALRELNIGFDTSTDGSTIFVEFGSAPRARMFLAERGLPRNATAGYELFDRLGSLGLTSFMQEVTKIRALEGELARSILNFKGVKSARVHLAIAEDGALRSRRQAPSASVVVGVDGGHDNEAQAIKHLVAAAVPGMLVDAVTVLSTDGTLLGAGRAEVNGTAIRLAELEQGQAEKLEAKVARTLAPLLGVGRFKVSVVARINADTRQVNETIYNPEGKVERSVRTVKESQSSQNSNGQSPVSVERNMPTDKPRNEGKQSNEDNQKKEELTNFEVSSKAVLTTSGGYSLERLSVAVVVDKVALVSAEGKPLEENAMDRRVSEISELISSAVGFSKERGDVIKVAVAEFADRPVEYETKASNHALVIVARQAGAIFNVLAILAGAFALFRFGIRPFLKAMIESDNQSRPGYISQSHQAQDASGLPASPDERLHPTIETSPRRLGQRRLKTMVDTDEEEVASILKHWVRAGDAA
jgi:flagellar M-ring protein FliF